jgi:thioredoxin-dependent peroxiredoxin
LLLIIAVIIYIYGPKEFSALKVENKAPEFKLLDEENQKRSLSEFKGKKIVLYFYPKDNTPGCTAQACGIRDKFKEFQENKIVVLGVSYDTPASHKLFKERQNLPFILLSDAKKEVAKKYGAYSSIINSLYPERKTFLINEEGKIIKILENVDIKTHVDDILTSFKSYDEQRTASGF